MSVKQLLSRDNFQLWLASNPELGEVTDHLQFLDIWLDGLKNGGGAYVQDLRDMAYDYIRRSRG